MNIELTLQSIRELCGDKLYDEGLPYVRADRVEWLHFDHEYSHYEATVHCKRKEFVSIDLDNKTAIQAACFCTLTKGKNSYCVHITAALISLHDMLYGSTEKGPDNSGESTADTPARQAAALPDLSEQQIVSDRLLSIFQKKRIPEASSSYLFDVREVMKVEYIIKLSTIHNGNPSIMLELRTGADRLYVVQHIRSFLLQIAAKQSFIFTSRFIYEPIKHRFSTADFTILHLLIQLAEQEEKYEQRMNKRQSVHEQQSRTNRKPLTDRSLYIPPLIWKELMPLLEESRQAFVIDETKEGIISQNFQPLVHYQQPLDASFTILKSEYEGYFELTADSIADHTLLPDYGLSYSSGNLIDIAASEAELLHELQQAAFTSDTNHCRIIIPEQHMETYVDQVIPSLKRIGAVELAPEISEKIVQYPLQARLYLDRLKKKLLLGLEFQYGDIILNPLEDRTAARGANQILIYDKEKEATILSHFKQDELIRTEGGFVIEDEEAQFSFLYDTVPLLEKLMTIYASSSVKETLFHEQIQPIIHLTFNERTNWLEFQIDLAGFADEDIKACVQAIQVKRRYFKLRNGSLAALEHSAYQKLIAWMNEVGLEHIAWDGVKGLAPAVKALTLLQFPDDIGESFRISKALQDRLRRIQNPDELNFPIPASLDHILRNYQKHGYQWMRTLAYYQFGGILADDMGLGKTIQSIAFLLSMLDQIRQTAENGRKKGVLIVTPASLLYNWEQELAKFAPDLQTAVIDGAVKTRRRQIANENNADVLITSYPTLRMDRKMHSKHCYHTLLLDEAQNFKNAFTQTAFAVKELQANHKFALTGTPIENRTDDLRSIFEAVFPELFDNKDSFRYMPYDLIAKRAAPFILRRLKSDVLKELPPKIESLQISELLPEQKKLYLAYLAKLKQDTLKHLDGDSFDKERLKILAGITRLRQLCCHPGLFLTDYSGGSAKLKQLFEIIEEGLNSGKRMLIFSQFTQMLGIISKELGLRGVPFYYLDGQTDAQQRVDMCTAFNNGQKDIFLISLKAGGTGLNLTGADTVILYDLWWNPAVLDQAADRAHRMGQRKTVQVVQLVSKGTVEEKMLQLHERKKNMIDAIIEAEAIEHAQPASLTVEDIKLLLSI